jgi:hypothetical protein
MFLPFYVGLEHNYQGCALPLSYGGLDKKHYNYMAFYQLEI